MYCRKAVFRTLSATFGLAASLAFVGTAAGASIIVPFENDEANVNERAASGLLERFAGSGLPGDRAEPFAFRNFSDLFMPNPEQAIAGSGAPSAAVFAGPPRGRAVGHAHSGGSVDHVAGGRSALNRLPGNGLGQGLGNSNAGGNNAGPGGGGGSASSGGGGGGSSSAASSSEGNSPGNSGNSNAGGNGNNGEEMVNFSGNGNGNGNPGCCHCGWFENGHPGKGHGKGNSGGNSGNAGGGGNAATIPLPAPLWMGLLGLAGVGWLRHRGRL